MVSTYSPHRDAGGVLHLNSPSHLSQIDPHAAIREIRRSLSRSPSKGAETRQHSFSSFSPSTGSLPFSPSPLSPSKRSVSDNLLALATMSSTNQPRTYQSSRLHRPAIRRVAPLQNGSRVRTSPKSPPKRILIDSSDSGNSSPMPLRKRSSTEADRELALSSGDIIEEKENEGCHDDAEVSWKSLSKQEKARTGGLMNIVAPSSPLKRSDAPVNLDQVAFGSPSAKRRSLHGPSLDLSIFDYESLASSEFSDDRRAQDDNDWFRSGPALTSSRFSTIPKRSSSLRKSTLQQRQSERSNNSNKLALMIETDSLSIAATPSLSHLKKGQRMSLDNHLPPMPRDSPFSSQGTLLNASIHPVTSAQNSQTQHFPHPLSRTMTQSSSTSSVQDDSPTHEPVHRPERPRSHDFSKSLPLGSSRPSGNFRSDDTQEYSSQGSFATPANYKSAKPLPAAFMSTGLISKKNRNVDEPNGGLSKAHMPDTPCKKAAPVFPNTQRFVPANPKVGAKKSRPSFGTPSTPFAQFHTSVQVAPFPFAKSVGIFGASMTRPVLARKTSFASIEYEEKQQSPSSTPQVDSQSTDSDFPPTPTKPTAGESPQLLRISPSPRHRTSIPNNHHGSLTVQGSRFASSKLSPVWASPGSIDGDGDCVMEESPSASLRPKSMLNVVFVPSPSFTRGRGLRNLNSPTPLSRKTLVFPFFRSPKSNHTKLVSLSPVTPRADEFVGDSPHTPQEGIFPPDPSGLSISGRSERIPGRPGSSSACAIPATPTGPREYFPNFSNRPSLNLASADAAEVDNSLTSRFERVDLVGTGEFSQVYRVSQPPPPSPYRNLYSILSRSSSRSSLPERVFAVKKSRHPYAGAKDRQRKIHEVDVLKALGHSDHVLAFVDSWEEQGHLYIQTEYCEEGTLDIFLRQIGLKARLDDFRIWKILLELSLGLKHIHESGYIHLDLKPANVLITFEGVLKIADFGMATKWPAKAGIEGEGDREYIGPEILMGRYDKPADIFALGLIMLETAGNVELPDNGASWQKLRNGDMSDVPSLTWSSEASQISRDASGNPLLDDVSSEELVLSEEQDVVEIVSTAELHQTGRDSKKPLYLARSGELTAPPAFMVDATHNQALDGIVRWMISPDPADRPLASQLLQTMGVHWAESRRRAGATVFEGNWGPADEVLAEDAEMIDV